VRDDVKRDLSDAAYEFTRVVWPAIRPCFGGGQVIPVETIEDVEVAKMLDVLGGIDYWHVMGNGIGVRGVASRVQWVDRAWDTFTIRERRPGGAKTELSKRLECSGVADGRLYPYLTVQAYLTKPRRSGELIQAHVTTTDSIIAFVMENYERVTRSSHGIGVWRQTNTDDGVEFLCVSATKMRGRGLHVKTVTGGAS
jgi:hypothetical protein